MAMSPYFPRKINFNLKISISLKETLSKHNPINPSTFMSDQDKISPYNIIHY